MRVILLAAGFGTRLYPLTKDKPKAFLPLGDKPLIDYLIANVAKIKPRSVTLITNNRFYESFIFWKSQNKFPFPIHIINNGIDSPSERSGAVLDLYKAFCDSMSPCQDSLILSTDNYFEYPLSLFLFHSLHHLPNPAIGVYDVQTKQAARNYGVVELDHNHHVKRFTEKPSDPSSTVVSVGIYLLPQESHSLLYRYLWRERKSRDRIGDFIEWLTERTQTLAVPIEGIWKDIGNLETYQALNQWVGERKNQ